MSNPKATFCSIAPKPPAEIMQSLDDVIAVVTLPSQETQEVNSTTEITTEKASKKKNDQKQERVEKETGWDDKSTGLLLSFLANFKPPKPAPTITTFIKSILNTQIYIIFNNF